MPRIPKKIPMRSATFPQPMYRSANGEYNRYNPIAANAYKEDLGLEMVQGPDMPLAIENRRQAMRNAMEEYEAEMAAERERQLLNRRAQAWNEYIDLPRRERKFWANRSKLAQALNDYDVPQDHAWYTKNYENFQQVPERPVLDNMYIGWPRSLNPEDYPEFTSFEELPDDLLDMPWRMW